MDSLWTIYCRLLEADKKMVRPFSLLLTPDSISMRIYFLIVNEYYRWKTVNFYDSRLQLPRLVFY